MAGLRPGTPIVVVDDDDGVATEVVKALEARRFEATTPDTVPEDAAAVLFLGRLRAIESPDRSFAISRERFLAASCLAEKLP